MPLFWICLAVITGIAAAPFVSVPESIILILIIISLLLAFTERKISRSQQHPLLNNALFKIPFAMIFFGILAGIYLFQSALPDITERNIAYYSGHSDMTVIGVVNADPRQTSRYTTATVKCEEITIDGATQPVRGKMRVSLPQGFYLAYGDRIQMQGNIESTIDTGQLPITSHEGREKIFVEMDFPEVEVLSSHAGNPIISMLFRTREQANEIIFDMVPFPESAVLAGILLGLDTSIPEYLWNGYRASGIAHIIVISGFNISIIAMMLLRFLEGKVREKFQIPFVISMVFLYTILVGADIPVVRAAIMATIGLPAKRIGRKTIGIHNLTLAATLMLILNPFLIWDMSFQLSFLATLALLILADPLTQWVLRLIYKDEEARDRPHLFLELITTTLCAAFVVFPIIFPLTGTLSLSSIPANIVVAPLQPMIMLLGGSAVLAGLVFPFVSRILGVIVWPLIAACNQIALRLSVHPASLVYLPVWVYWVSLAGVTFILLFFLYKQIVELTKPQPANEIPEKRD